MLSLKWKKWRPVRTKKAAAKLNPSESCHQVEDTESGDDLYDEKSLNALPQEILEMLFECLDALCIVRLRLVSRRLNAAVDGYVDRFPENASELRKLLISQGRELKDGHYRLSVRSDGFAPFPMIVYCHELDTEEPKEFLTLRGDPEPSELFGDMQNTMNYSERRFRLDDDNWAAVRTNYSKVRLRLPNYKVLYYPPQRARPYIHIQCDDYTFCTTKRYVFASKKMPFNMWYDYYSRTPVPFAVASVDQFYGLKEMEIRSNVNLGNTPLCTDDHAFSYFIGYQKHKGCRAQSLDFYKSFDLVAKGDNEYVAVGPACPCGDFVKMRAKTVISMEWHKVYLRVRTWAKTKEYRQVGLSSVWTDYEGDIPIVMREGPRKCKPYKGPRTYCFRA